MYPPPRPKATMTAMMRSHHMVFIFSPGAPEKKTDVGSTEGGMTKKYTPPGGWAAQRQRQILWFLLMFLFFGGMGWFLHVQVGEIMRIERDTERMRRRRELEALRDREARERQIRREALFGHGGIPPPDDVFQRDQERVNALAQALLEQQRQIRQLRAPWQMWNPPQHAPIEEWRWLPFDRRVQDLALRPRGG